MKWSDIKKSLTQKFKEYLPQLGLELYKFDSYSFYLRKKYEGATGFTVFGKYMLYNAINFQGGALSIEMNNVEDIIFPLIIKHNLLNIDSIQNMPKITFGSYYESEENKQLYLNASSIVIANENDLDNFFVTLKPFLENYTLPWFEKYSNIKELSDFINTLSMQELLNCFAGPFPASFYRPMLVAHLCSNVEKVVEIKEECLKRFELCKTDSFYSAEIISNYYNSLEDLSNQINNK
jgi:hypothetical protein